MKLVVLTTRTLHHTYFVQELAKMFSVNAVFVECKTNKPSFETHHPFEDQRELYEREVFFGNKAVRLEDFSQVIEVETVNGADSVAKLRQLEPDVIIVFGTGRLRADVINACPDGIANLHGGNPAEYRGLDSHLWAIYHRDYENLIVTLHRVNEQLDDGEIILDSPIHIQRGMKLHQLRRFNTEICVQLAVLGLDMFKQQGRFISRLQLKRGRYYSFMPAVLKDFCKERFERYTETIA
ncbi:MAG TPA: hypothetical protein HPP87_02790 [Planctomycetes bacterium]|nr:hypothetical protein [Planctomycetota bacterium]HIJ70275.1 hypothetical protein [Planctomycetota bacterium]